MKTAREIAQNVIRSLEERAWMRGRPLNPDLMDLINVRNANLVIKTIGLRLMDSAAPAFEDFHTITDVIKFGLVDRDPETLFTIFEDYSTERLVEMFGQAFADFIRSDLVWCVRSPNVLITDSRRVLAGYYQFMERFNEMWPN